MKTNPENYKWGMIYFNPRDSRLFVPKIDPIRGWTVNFANPLSYVIIIGLIVLFIFLGTL